MRAFENSVDLLECSQHSDFVFGQSKKSFSHGPKS